MLLRTRLLKKTWRICKVGSSSWNSSYLLYLDHGDGLSVPSGYTQALTGSVINQGQMVDLTVNMTAPAASGTYTGYRSMRGGVLFGITTVGGTFLGKVVGIFFCLVSPFFQFVPCPLPGSSQPVTRWYSHFAQLLGNLCSHLRHTSPIIFQNG